MQIPQGRWFIVELPINMDDLGVPPIFGHTRMGKFSCHVRFPVDQEDGDFLYFHVILMPRSGMSRMSDHFFWGRGDTLINS